MKLYQVNLESDGVDGQEKEFVASFRSCDAVLQWIRHQQPDGHIFAVIVTHTDEVLDETLWIMECGEPPSSACLMDIASILT